jgi:hypothetical protein
MKKVVCFLALLLGNNTVQGMNQLCTFAKYCDENPFIRTATSALLAAGLLGSGGYCTPEIAFLATLNLNAAYDFGSLRFKRYKSSVIGEKACVGYLAVAVNTTASFHVLVDKVLGGRGCQNILENLQGKPLTKICAQFCTDNCKGFCRRPGPLQVSPFMLEEPKFPMCGQYCIENCDPLCTSGCRY